MAEQKSVGRPTGDVGSFLRERFVANGMGHDVYRKGRGPAIVVVTEMPGISPLVFGFADRLVQLGCTAVLPDLFGTAGRDPAAKGRFAGLRYQLRSMGSACLSREFAVFATGRTSPVVAWLRALAAAEHSRCGGPGVGVIGMCFSGGFALAMAVDPWVLAPVLAQPSLPLAVTPGRRRTIDCSAADLECVAQRCFRNELQVLGLRFRGDPFVPEERFALLRQKLGDGFVAVELEPTDRNPAGPLPWPHSVLTVDLVDEPGTPTRAALDRVLDLMHTTLLCDASDSRTRRR